jgi:uncharacterized protein YbaA (DUF1428 family)
MLTCLDDATNGPVHEFLNGQKLFLENHGRQIAFVQCGGPIFRTHGPVPKDKLDQYRKLAAQAGVIWMEHGALGYKECVMDDDVPEMPEMPEGTPAFKMVNFSDLAGIKDGETVLFSFIVYKSREHRDQVNARVMNDERMKDACNPDDMPFDPSRMAFGGFKAIVDL